MNPVKIKPQLVKDFWPRYKKGAITIIIIMQVLILCALAGILYSSGFLFEHIVKSALVLGAQTVLGIFTSLLMYRFLARPVKYLMAALVHVSGERTNITPPNPNEKVFEKSGFKPVLQTIYQLASDTETTFSDDEDIEDSTTKPSSGTQDLLSTAVDQGICGFVIMGQDRKIIYASKATPVRITTDGEQLLDLLFSENDTLDTWWTECEENAVHAEKTWPRIPNKLPNEENRRFFDVIASYNKGTKSEMVITLIDRTHLYELGEEELDFIAFAAHELRGPITVIRGYIDVLADELSETLQEDQKELFRRLSVSATRLSGYINNILNTSRYDRRHLRMHLSETTINAVYETIHDDMSLRARSQNRALVVSLPEGLPTIAADTTSLAEVFSNIIDNAIKYSNEGGIINVSAVSKGDSVEILIEDHGIGMPSSVVSNLFQKFYRSHRSRETVAGTGIGLYISKAIVESHGGTISVRSEDGRGSTFIVSLPTYKMVADKLKAGNNGNETLIGSTGSWIKNHNMYRG